MTQPPNWFGRWPAAASAATLPPPRVVTTTPRTDDDWVKPRFLQASAAVAVRKRPSVPAYGRTAATSCRTRTSC